MPSSGLVWWPAARPGESRASPTWACAAAARWAPSAIDCPCSAVSERYPLKDRVWDGDRFAEAVRRVAEGGSALDPEVVSHMLGHRRVHAPLEQLSPREHDVLGLMAEGRSNQAIADALVISGRAVEKHVSSIFTKLNLPPAPEDHRRVLAVLAFLRS